jgi:ABC-2 type transport system ATP-binding protein
MLKAKGLVKEFKLRKNEKVIAVNQISFDVSTGEIIGYVGLNGAGKSTTIKLLTGLIKPSSGTVEFLDKDMYRNRKKLSKEIGVVFGHKSQLIWDLNVVESCKLNKCLYGISDELYERNLKELCQILNIEKLLNRQVRTLSSGERIKCDIMCGLLHNPKILYLDEPTIGLDIISKQQIRNALRDINSRNNTTIILTSHDLDDIEEICDRLILIDKGVIMFDEPMVDFLNRNKIRDLVRITLSNKINAKFLQEIELENLTFCNEYQFEFSLNKVKNSLSEIFVLLGSKCEIKQVEVIKSDFKEQIRSLYV